jgi:hypothetical protein
MLAQIVMYGRGPFIRAFYMVEDIERAPKLICLPDEFYYAVYQGTITVNSKHYKVQTVVPADSDIMDLTWTGKW